MDKIESKKEQLRKEIWPIVQIYAIAYDNLLYSKYLYLPETDLERVYIMSSMHFKVIRTYLWRLCITETAKLVSTRERDEYRIVGLLSKLNKSGHYGDLRIDTAKIVNWEKILLENKKVISDIMVSRDKSYAHTDKDREKYEKNISISIKQVEVILNLVETILKEIYHSVFESGLVLHTPGFHSGKFDVIKILADSREREIRPLVDLMRKLDGKE